MVNGSCLCQEGSFWDGNNCAVCDESLPLVADKFNCVCSDHYYMINNTCPPCNPSCLTCRNDSEYSCETCDETRYNKNLLDSRCLCKERVYMENFTCLPCHNSCTNCTGPEIWNCICESNGIFGPCTCPKFMFWNLTCQNCHYSCLSCIGDQYFMCTECSDFIYEGICCKSCPRGFKAVNKTCVNLMSLALKFSFYTSTPFLETISNDSANLYSIESLESPLHYPNRGIYFSRNSYSIEFLHFIFQFG